MLKNNNTYLKNKPKNTQTNKQTNKQTKQNKTKPLKLQFSTDVFDDYNLKWT